MKALVVVLAAVAFAVGTSRLSWAEDAAPSAQQVDQLQKQLAAMQKQMAEMQKTIEAGNLPVDQRQNMMGHMGMMQQGWQGMHKQCCMMNPGGCPMMGGTGMPQTTP